MIAAASGGNVIEWYDFYIRELAAVLSVKFFEKSHPVAALLSTIALFTAGFFDPSIGSIPGLTGWATGWALEVDVTSPNRQRNGAGQQGAIGLIPTYASTGSSAAFILFGLADDPGPCLGGEYGWVITLRRRA